MRVLNVNCTFKQGSTGKIVLDIHHALTELRHKSIVCYGRGKEYKEESVYKLISEPGAKLNALRAKLTGLQYSGCYLATYRLIKIIRKSRPDIIHLHCINGNCVNIYQLLKYLKKKQVKTILTQHSEFMYTGSCGCAFTCDQWKTGCIKCPRLKKATGSLFFDRSATAWRKMCQCLADYHQLTITCVSGWLIQRSKMSKILGERNYILIENGTSIQKTNHPEAITRQKEKLGLTNEKVILFVTSSFTDKTNDNKGGFYILQLAERLKDSKTKIIVVGGRETGIDFAIPDNMIYDGIIRSQTELAVYYTLADVSVIVSRQEAFCMPCAESLCCGTPVVGFMAGGPESVSLPEYSEFVPYGNIDRLAAVIQKWLMKNIDKDLISAVARQRYAGERMAKQYIALYKTVLAGGDQCD